MLKSICIILNLKLVTAYSGNTIMRKINVLNVYFICTLLLLDLNGPLDLSYLVTTMNVAYTVYYQAYVPQ